MTSKTRVFAVLAGLLALMAGFVFSSQPANLVRAVASAVWGS